MEFTKHVRVREEKFGSVIFETLKEKVFVTNETGSSILRLLKEGKSPEEIINILDESYDSEPQKVVRDEVTDFISSLRENNLLE
jgi:hypothetical protein